MTNRETRREKVQPQEATTTPTPSPAPNPMPSPTPEPSPSPESALAQSEFLDIKRALTERRADPDPEPGWVLPRVDEKAAFSDPTLNKPNS